MISLLKLSLFFVSFVASIQANQDQFADLKSCAKGMLPVAAGLVVGKIIGDKIGHSDATTIAGGLLGALADHYIAGGKRDQHYWCRKGGNVVPILCVANIIYFNRRVEKLVERMLAKSDVMYADTKNLLSRESRLPSSESRRPSYILIYDQLSWFVSRTEKPGVIEDLSVKHPEVTHEYKIDLLKYVKNISEPEQDGTRIASIGDYKATLRGYGVDDMYNLWRSLQENNYD